MTLITYITDDRPAATLTSAELTTKFEGLVKSSGIQPVLLDSFKDMILSAPDLTIPEIPTLLIKKLTPVINIIVGDKEAKSGILTQFDQPMRGYTIDKGKPVFDRVHPSGSPVNVTGVIFKPISRVDKAIHRLPVLAMLRYGCWTKMFGSLYTYDMISLISAQSIITSRALGGDAGGPMTADLTNRARASKAGKAAKSRTKQTGGLVTPVSTAEMRGIHMFTPGKELAELFNMYNRMLFMYDVYDNVVYSIANVNQWVKSLPVHIPPNVPEPNRPLNPEEELISRVILGSVVPMARESLLSLATNFGVLRFYYRYMANKTDKSVVAELKRLEELKSGISKYYAQIAAKKAEEFQSRMLNSISREKFKKHYANLNKADREVVNNIYKHRTAEVKSPHIALIRKLRDNNREVRFGAARDLMKLPDSDRVLCQHVEEMIKMLLAKPPTPDVKITQRLVSEFSGTTPIDNYYYCRLCGEELAPIHADDVFDREQKTGVISGLTQSETFMWAQAAHQISGVLVSRYGIVANSINGAVSEIMPHLSEIEIKISQVRTYNTAMIQSVMRLYTAIYSLAMCIKIVENNKDISFRQLKSIRLDDEPAEPKAMTETPTSEEADKQANIFESRTPPLPVPNVPGAPDPPIIDSAESAEYPHPPMPIPDVSPLSDSPDSPISAPADSPGTGAATRPSLQTGVAGAAEKVKKKIAEKIKSKPQKQETSDDREPPDSKKAVESSPAPVDAPKQASKNRKPVQTGKLEMFTTAMIILNKLYSAEIHKSDMSISDVKQNLVTAYNKLRAPVIASLDDLSEGLFEKLAGDPFYYYVANARGLDPVDLAKVLNANLGDLPDMDTPFSNIEPMPVSETNKIVSLSFNMLLEYFTVIGDETVWPESDKMIEFYKRQDELLNFVSTADSAIALARSRPISRFAMKRPREFYKVDTSLGLLYDASGSRQSWPTVLVDIGGRKSEMKIADISKMVGTPEYYKIRTLDYRNKSGALLSKSEGIKTAIRTQASVEAFYTFYQFRCPSPKSPAGVHSIGDSACKVCGMSKALVESRDVSTYQKWLDQYVKHKNEAVIEGVLNVSKPAIVDDKLTYTTSHIGKLATLTGVPYNVLFNIGLCEDIEWKALVAKSINPAEHPENITRARASRVADYYRMCSLWTSLINRKATNLPFELAKFAESNRNVKLLPVPGIDHDLIYKVSIIEYCGHVLSKLCEYLVQVASAEPGVSFVKIVVDKIVSSEMQSAKFSLQKLKSIAQSTVGPVSGEQHYDVDSDDEFEEFVNDEFAMEEVFDEGWENNLEGNL